MKRRFGYLSTIPIESYELTQPKILLSLKEFKLLLSKQPPTFSMKGPIATKTKLGWMIFGPVDSNDRSDINSERNVLTIQEDDLDSLRNLNNIV